MHLGAKAPTVAGATALRRDVVGAGRSRRRKTRSRSTSRSPPARGRDLFFLVGLARAGEKGLDYELTFLNGEELAIQAILARPTSASGSLYAVIQRASVPVRLVPADQPIIFFPVVNAEIESWQDMDGKSMTYHSRGGPLEALAEIVAEREGITLGTPNFVPSRRTGSCPGPGAGRCGDHRPAEQEHDHGGAPGQIPGARPGSDRMRW